MDHFMIQRLQGQPIIKQKKIKQMVTFYVRDYQLNKYITIMLREREKQKESSKLNHHNLYRVCL